MLNLARFEWVKLPEPLCQYNLVEEYYPCGLINNIIISISYNNISLSGFKSRRDEIISKNELGIINTPKEWH